jgi:hypothetical protein
MKILVKILLALIVFLVLSKLLTVILHALGGLTFTLVVGVVAWIIVGRLLGGKR